MKITPTNLVDSFVISPNIFQDGRGFFYEFYNRRSFTELTGLDINFIQDNISKSSKGVLRGLHFQKGNAAQSKLVSILKGSVLDIIVDLRKDSPSFKKYFSIVLSAENHLQLFIPKGFAHGYLCLEDDTIFCYKIDNYYNKSSESGVKYNDPDLNIDWQFDLSKVTLSDKDTKLPYLKEILHEL